MANRAKTREYSDSIQRFGADLSMREQPDEAAGEAQFDLTAAGLEVAYCEWALWANKKWHEKNKGMMK